MPDRTLPIITPQEFDDQSISSILVSVNHRKVYDVSSFLDDHPGGGDIIEPYRGKDITDVLKDPLIHEHSDNVYLMLDDTYLVAILATPEEAAKIVTDENRQLFTLTRDAEDALHVTTDFGRDFERHGFLDLSKPLLMQVLFATYTKEFYLEQIHKPRHYGMGRSAPIFGNFLEPLSKTPWWIVPLLWVPADIYLVSIALQGAGPVAVALLFGLGLCIWTLVEYCLHRFVFHIEYYLPDHPLALTLHFLLHGVHHYLPMDRLRLVMPPSLLVILTTPLYHLAHLVFFYNYFHAMSVFAGAFLGYVMYDVTHYSLHHKQLPPYFKVLKKHHLDHHYKNYDLAYGVSSMFWDNVFGTSMSNVESRLLETK